MRAVLQRVSEAAVEVEDGVSGTVRQGLLVYLGVAADDGDEDVAYIADKVRHVRIFPDDQDRMNWDVVQAGGEVLVVSAFTVQADARRGRRPSFDTAASHEYAAVRYEQVCQALVEAGIIVQRGVFRAKMDVHSVNAGPICILLDSRRGF